MDDISIMPIEAMLQSPGDTTTTGSKLLSREEFWYKQLGSIYPYGLNDNVKQLGNVSKKIGHGLFIYYMFNKHRRKFHKRLENQVIRLRLVVIENSIFFNLLNNYQYHNFC